MRLSRRRSVFIFEAIEPRLMLYGPLVFSDDFSQTVGSLPNASTWKYDTGTENGAYYIDDPTTMQIVNDATAQDGKALALTTHLNSSGGYLGARINTSIAPIGGQLQYGHVEARIRLPGGPNGAGDGIGCSFWMLGSNYPQVGWPQSGEMDIMENSGENPGKNGATIHGPGYSQPGIYSNYYLPSGQYFYQSYHTFAIDWSPGVVQFSVDGNVYAVRNRSDLTSGQSWVFDHPFFIILGIGRDGGAVDANTVYPQTMYVDYVHAYGYNNTVGAPSALTASAVAPSQINLTWQDPAEDATSFTLQRSRTNSFTTIDAAYSVADNLGTFHDTGLTPGTAYFYRMQAISTDGTITNTSPWSYLSSATTWTDQDIATTGGSVTFSNDVLSLAGGGSSGIAGSSDAFNFASQSTTGDGTLLAQITSITNTNSSAGAGVMFRNTTASSSAFAAVLITPSNSAVFDYRTSAGGTVASTSISSGSLPVWVELVRAGTTFAAYKSTDGAAWTQIGTTQTVNLNPTVLSGVAITSHAAALCTANVSNLSFSPPVTAPTLSLNAGGSATAGFTADANYNAGSTSTTSHAIDTFGVITPASPAVYQSNRYGAFSYTITGLAAGQAYDVQMLFAEAYWTAVGSRVFDVDINNVIAVSNLDMFAETGGEYRAASKDFITTATSSGQIAIQSNSAIDNAQLNGIRIIPQANWISLGSGQSSAISATTTAPGVTLATGSTLSLTANAHQTLVTNGLALQGNATLDLTTNSLVVRGGNLTAITSMIQSGFNAGAMNGPGIVSSTAAGNSAHLTTIGVMSNYNGGGGATVSSFGGQSVNANDILARYTYFGDANLDGTVNSTDYALIDAGYLSHGSLAGWQNGDFNYDGVINGSDYTLIDNAFNQQGATLTTQVAKPAGLHVTTTAPTWAADSASATDEEKRKRMKSNASFKVQRYDE